MAHRRSPLVDADLEELWAYVADATSSDQAADRLIDSIIARFWLLAQLPYAG